MNKTPILVSGPVKHTIGYNSPPMLSWWIKCKHSHLQLIGESQVYGRDMIYCAECRAGFTEDFSKHHGFKSELAS